MAHFLTAAMQPFALFVGVDSRERGAVRVFAPSGEEAWRCCQITMWERFQPDAAGVREGLWRVELVRPKGMCRTIFLDVAGTGGYLFLSPDRYWR